MSRLLGSCVEVFGSCCGCGGSNRGGRDPRRNRKTRSICKNLRSDSADFNEGPYIKSETQKLAQSDTRGLRMTAHNGVGHVPLTRENGQHICKVQTVNHVGGTASSSTSENNNMTKEEHCVNGGYGESKLKPAVKNGGNGSAIVTNVQDKLFDGLMKLFSDTLESLVFVLCPVGKARRKEKDPGSSGGAGGSNDEGKLYLQSALLEKHVNETELSRLVAMPEGIDENEWIASHTISLFEHVNLIYGTISEYCTSTTCPDMTAPCTRNYLWFDEKGKKVKVAAPQYIDYVMTFIQKTIMDESIFPTKSTNAFPSSFIPFVKKIFRLLFHVIAHIYHSHFRQIVLLSLHAHLNCVFAHFTMFNEAFKLVEEKETEVLQDLALAMKLKCDLIVEDDPMNSESNKENILSKSSSSQGVFPSSHPGSSGTSDVATSSTSTFSPTSEGSLLMKEPALVSISSGSR